MALQAAYQSASSDTGADDQGAPGCDVFGQGDADTGALPLPAEDNSTDVSASADMTAQVRVCMACSGQNAQCVAHLSGLCPAGSSGPCRGVPLHTPWHPTFLVPLQDASARSWGQDRMDQLRLPLNGDYSPGDLDGRGVHGAVAAGMRW